ncbi:MAG: hypothetical protein HY854_08755 [Burkholderiales bacterium]|nr:hypothetical protein [Burkholderiales bacterium]
MTRELPLIIHPRGRLANVMFQYMLALQLKRRLGDRAKVYGPGLPEWDWPAVGPAPHPARAMVLRGHMFDLDEVAHLLRAGAFDAVVIEAWGMRVEYYADVAEQRALFVSKEVPQPVGDDEVLLSVRAEDIEGGGSAGYYPLPFRFYEAVVEAQRKRPVFMGQLQPSPYTDALRKRFPAARYLPAAPAANDFQTLRSAGHVALSISSFAWLAAWLSESAQVIHLPVAGLFDPARGHQNLLPVGDARYRYWSIEFPEMAARAGLQAHEWAEGERSVTPREEGWAMNLARVARARRVPAAKLNIPGDS